MTRPSMPAHQFIEGHQLVLLAFGRWPGFHDGEVHSVLLDRTRQRADGKFYPSVELVVRGWNMSSQVTESGYFKLENDSVVHFLFEDISELALDGLNHQNVLSSLDLTLVNGPDDTLLAVELSHCYGLSGGFQARRAKVVSVTPFAEG